MPGGQGRPTEVLSLGCAFLSTSRTCLPDRCTADADCPANETCVSGSCRCLPGYVVEDANCKAAECLSNRDCFWKNSECVSGRCTCRVGCSIIAGECNRKTFGHCSQECDSTVPNSLCGERPWCTCKPGYVYRDQDGVASCVAIQCSRLSPCQDSQRQCVHYQCVCANTSRPCDWNQDLALQVFEEEGAVYKTVVLFLGGALTFILVASVPVVVLQRVRVCRQSGASCVEPLDLTAASAGSERAPKRPYPFEVPFS
ncbi:tenascin-X-like [Ixodes scapularis]|uniref:tenascin-X-like n=1 Tax=Ixodes scapularis TaxID=6945 RepID=UPI001C38415F|nr:tenascin-X-like [Ixodes scapularis]